MSCNWDRFLSDCRQVSNASVICADGVIFTHKLVLAHISSLMKNTLKEIPPADEATIFLKDFSKEDVELFMSEMSLGQKSRNTDLLLLFGNKSVSPVKDISVDFPTSSARKEVKVKDEDDWDAEEHLFSDTFSNHAEFQSDANFEELDDTTEEFKKELTENPRSDSQKIRNERIEISEEKEVMEKKEMDPDELEQFDRKTEEKIREYEKDLIENPKTEKQRVANKKIEKKIRYEKALAAFKTGRVKSYRQAGIIYGVNNSTLRKYIIEGTFYKGKGMELSRFTAEEEKIIADRIWKLKEGGSLLTARMVKKILLEEAEIVKVNQPERTEQMTFASKPKLWSFTLAFTKRHEMDKICDAENRKDREQRRIHECEICYNTFTFQKSLRDHRKKCHSFLVVSS